MIKVYLAEIPAFIEGEDISIQYCVYKDAELLAKKEVVMNYVRPVLVGQVSMQRLLKELKPYKGQEILVLVHDTTLFESIRGILKTKHTDLMQLAKVTQKAVAQFGNINIENVSANPLELKKWAEVIETNF